MGSTAFYAVSRSTSTSGHSVQQCIMVGPKRRYIRRRAAGSCS